MPTSPPPLQFVRMPGYQTQPVPGSSWLYTIDPNRPIGYTQPSRLLSPTLPTGGVWRAARRDSSQPVEQLVAVDMGVYRTLSDAQQACQDDANYNQLDWALVWLLNAGYESRPVPQFPWLYDIAQPSPDPNGVLYWRAVKRDASLVDAFQNAIPLGNFDDLADAMTACHSDFSITYPPYPQVTS